jgi:CRISPR-associated protein Cmr4
MKPLLLGMLAESALHHGAGRSAGIIDLPVAREAATDVPFIAGSGVKGALRDRARQRYREDAEINRCFGEQEHAGMLSIADARLLLLPVRSLTGSYKWLTCPLLLERYRRDLARCGIHRAVPEVPLSAREGRSGAAGAGKGTLFLEEREFAVTGSLPAGLTDAIAPLLRHADTRKRLGGQLVVVGDDDFAWFCRYALPIAARNQLERDTKISKNLWYEESLPPDTVLYTLVMARDDKSATSLMTLFPDEEPYLQLGGNETVGHGWVAITVQPGGAA